MTDSLRERLKDRIEEVAARVPVGHVAEVSLGDPGVLDAVADEVIRCMEWARRHEHSTCRQEGPLHFCGALTLPPDSWQPPQAP